METNGVRVEAVAVGGEALRDDPNNSCGGDYIICGPLREHILFAYPTNFAANFENNLDRKSVV